MTPPALESLAGELRRRVAEGRYAEAQRALAVYCRTVSDVLGSLTPEEIRQLETRSMDLLDEMRRRVSQDRAHLAERLARLPRQDRFRCATPQHTWDISG